jgi:HSP20 family molecular chaperone IbpA
MNQDTSQKSPAFNPPVQVNDEGRQIHISIGLPGVTEEQIRIDLEKTLFTLSVLRDDTVLKKSIRIPQGARFFRKSFSDGKLEIVLERPAS